MFNRKKIKELNDKIDKLSSKLNKENEELNNDLNNAMQQIDNLKSQLFKLKYPNGQLALDVTHDCFINFIDRSITYRYIDNKNGGIAFATIIQLEYCYNNDCLKSYKIIDKNNKVYIGLKLEKDNKDKEQIEKYFILDKNQNVVIEYENSIEFDVVKWQEYKNEDE